MTESSGDRLFDFDATGMWRLFTDVQRLGFETAASVARRFGRLVEEDLGPRWRPESTAAKDQGTGDNSYADSAEERLNATVQSAMDAYAELMQASWDAFNAIMDLTLDMARPWLPGRGGHGVELTAASGERATGSIYIHNTSSVAAEKIVVSADGLIGPGGELIKSDTVTIEPAEIESIAAGGKAEVKITVSLDAKAVPGRYVGLLRASTQPPTELQLAVVVVAK